MKKILLYILAFSFFWIGCTRKIDLDINPGETFMYLDAFVTNQIGEQRIVINHSDPYLGETKAKPVEGAQVVLYNITKNKTYNFDYVDGAYIHEAAFPIVTVGDSSRLEVTINGVLYTATDKMYRVPEIDSITLHYKSESVLFDAGIYGEVHIQDIGGGTDYYWMRSTYNSDDPAEGNNLAIDGGFYENLFDGLPFITPLRESVNEYGPFNSGGQIDVRLRSLSKQTYGFLELLFNSSDGSGLFASILKNIPTNVISPPNKMRLIGWYATTAENSTSVIIP